ncbi:MAG: replication initiation protein [Treponema sp.]|jgi:plasmid replication initiation protein|nr:replication initiation protein [Treponema sp.]
MSDELFPDNTPESLGVTPRFVLQHNAISRSIHNLSATAKKLTAMAMALLPSDLASLTAAFTYTEFCKATGYAIGGESFRFFKEAVKECLNNKIYIETKSPKNGKEIWEGYSWFSYSKIDDGSGVCTMMFSPQLAEVLTEMKRVYAKINLRDLGLLQSKYALRLFEIATSYESLAGKDGNERGAWYYERSVQELRHMLGVSDEAYPETKRFRQKVIEEPVKEINAAGIGLEITTEGIKQGRRLMAIRLNCKKTARKTPARRGRQKKAEGLGQPDLPEQNPKTDDSRGEKEAQHLKELYPEEFAGMYEAALSQIPVLDGGAGGSFRKMAAEGRALETLRAAHGIVK